MSCSTLQLKETPWMAVNNQKFYPNPEILGDLRNCDAKMATNTPCRCQRAARGLLVPLSLRCKYNLSTLLCGCTAWLLLIIFQIILFKLSKSAWVHLCQLYIKQLVWPMYWCLGLYCQHQVLILEFSRLFSWLPWSWFSCVWCCQLRECPVICKQFLVQGILFCYCLASASINVIFPQIIANIILYWLIFNLRYCLNT